MKSMTKGIIIFAAVLAAASTASAAALTYAGFSGTSGEAHGTSGTGDTGWNAAWDNQGGANGNHGVTNTSPMTYGALITSPEYLRKPQYNFESIGRRLATGPGSAWDTAGRVSDPWSNQLIDQGTVWASFLIRVNSGLGSWEGGTSVVFHESNTAWWTGETDAARIYAPNSGTQWYLGVGANNAALGNLTVGQTHLVVLKFELSTTDGQNNVYAWLDPAPATLGGPDLATGTANASFTGLNSSDLRFKSIATYLEVNADRVNVDEFRVGLTYADVTPVPEPTVLSGLAVAAALIAGLRRRK